MISDPFVPRDKSSLRFEDHDAEQSIPQRFRQQVAKYAGRIAIKSPHYEWSYEELNEVAQRIAGAYTLSVKKDIVKEVTMILDHALGPPGGTGSVEDRREPPGRWSAQRSQGSLVDLFRRC